MVTTPRRQSTPGGRGKTAPKAKGINVNLLAPPDKMYLCEKICAASKFPTAKLRKASKLGYFLSPQLSVDGMIMLDYHMFKGQWRYVPEVSFDMRQRPPKPIYASEAYQLFPPHYPYWGYPRKGTRRPDVTLIDGENQFALEQANIIRVVEIKFGKDRLGKTQMYDYKEIAGELNKVTVISDQDCECPDKPSKTSQTAPNSVPVATPAPNLTDTFEELYQGLKDKKLPIYAPKPHPAMVPVSPKKPSVSKPTVSKPAVSLAPYASKAPLNSNYTPFMARPAGVPTNAHAVRNIQTGHWEWVVPTLKVIGAVVVTAVVVVALVTGVGEVAAGAVTLTEFVIAGAEALAARYGARALASLAF